MKEESLHRAFEQSCVFSSSYFEKAHSKLKMNEESLLLKCNLVCGLLLLEIGFKFSHSCTCTWETNAV